jgi:hypothetical protein
MARRPTTVIDQAIYEIRYDTTIEAGDIRVELKDARKDIKLGVINARTERAVALAKEVLEGASSL